MIGNMAAVSELSDASSAQDEMEVDLLDEATAHCDFDNHSDRLDDDSPVRSDKDEVAQGFGAYASSRSPSTIFSRSDEFTPNPPEYEGLSSEEDDAESSLISPFEALPTEVSYLILPQGAHADWGSSLCKVSLRTRLLTRTSAVSL